MKDIIVKRLAAITAAAALVATFLTASPATADNVNAESASTLAAAYSESSLAEALQADDIDLTAATVDPSVVIVDTTSALGSGESVKTHLSLDTASATASVMFSTDAATLNDATYVIDVRELNDKGVEATVTDTLTGESVEYASSDGDYAAVPLILGIPIAIAVLEALLTSAAVVIIGAAAYVAAAEAIKAINKEGSTFQHFVALRQSTGLFFGKGLTLNEAISIGRNGQDTWSRTKAGAVSVARGVKGAIPVGPERDAGGANKFCHYHPFNRTPAMHAFYGTATSAC